VFDQILADHLDRIVLSLARELRDRAAGILRQVRRNRYLHALPRRYATPVVESIAFDVVAYAFASVPALEALEHRVHATGLHPLRQQILEGIAARRVGMGIAVDV